jgi:hypothetical protein
MNQTMATAALLALCLATSSAQEGKEKKEPKYFNSYLGKAPPKLTIGDKDWINTKTPLTLEGLKGKVVWLEFSYSH